ncbi:sigma-70 family RNA polymerase sigma factor [Jiangella mangrovi]|uniref:RNA polymerase sigma factor n=1 Tax=Jiangella mangrovi TaxID=1524084 RepID=A0A7W9GPY9_9ACTN|nr:sigma-70 family RNA polymerase sigma factor [Jiangella mangrovi]MBB5787909.1 RNA polymerase primary sigma factor/RNA polymerase nonessential primary-like sigma factor [Jiangella mangrovi]
MTMVEEQVRAPDRAGEADYDLVGQYLKQISATPLLSAAEEVELARRIEAGVFAASLLETEKSKRRREELEALVRDGEQAKDHMIRANLRLVVSAARKYYRNSGLPFLDVVQEGNLGLIRAVEKFDYTKGFKFSTYAMWWIRQAIERGKAERARTIRLPVHVLETLSKIGKAERKLAVSLGREPTAEELAAETDLAPARVIELRRISRDTLSLDTPVGDEGSASIGDLIEDTETPQATDVIEFQALGEQVRGLVNTLAPREALIVSMRFGLEDGEQHTLQEVAERVGLTKERVRQLEKLALAELRDPARHRPLLEWAG